MDRTWQAIAFFIVATICVHAESPSQHIDTLVEAELARQQLKPNAPVDDATFLRRTYLNIAGRIPTIEEARDFQSNPDRSKLIADVLNSEAFVSHFYNFWADLFRFTTSEKQQRNNLYAHFQLWIKDAIRKNMPYDEFVRNIVAARGKSWESGTIAYYWRDRGMPLDNMSNTVRIFLGTRLECAQCHDHPFDKWTQMDYYKMAAFSYEMASVFLASDFHEQKNRYLAKLEEKATEEYLHAIGKGDQFPVVRVMEQDPQRLERYIKIKSAQDSDPWIGPSRGVMTADEFRNLVKRGWGAARQTVELDRGARHALNGSLYRPLAVMGLTERNRTLRLPYDYQYDDASPHDQVGPSTMFGNEAKLESHDRLKIDAYADWMTSSDTPRFTRVIANRLWRFAFGAGIFEPVDDLTDHTYISNPELLAYLEQLTIDSDYNIKAILEVIFNTNTWQREADREETVLGAAYYFPGPKLRRMTAEQIWDSVVSLCVPNADHYRPNARKQLVDLQKERLIWESLEEKNSGDYAAMVEKIAELANHERAERPRLAKAMMQANAVDDNELVAKLRNELRELGNRYSDAIEAIGWEELKIAERDGTLYADALKFERAPPPFDGRPKIRPLPVPLDKSGPELRSWTAGTKRELTAYSRSVAKMARASELRMPAPRGHFLRSFGQSDRELIQNSSDSASIPQALALLNGDTIDLLNSPFSVFGREIELADSPEEKVKIIFLGLLSRHPNVREKELAEEQIQRLGDRAYSAIIWALLNARQFIFVQ